MVSNEKTGDKQAVLKATKVLKIRVRWIRFYTVNWIQLAIVY